MYKIILLIFFFPIACSSAPKQMPPWKAAALADRNDIVKFYSALPDIQGRPSQPGIFSMLHALVTSRALREERPLFIKTINEAYKNSKTHDEWVANAKDNIRVNMRHYISLTSVVMGATAAICEDSKSYKDKRRELSVSQISKAGETLNAGTTKYNVQEYLEQVKDLLFSLYMMDLELFVTSECIPSTAKEAKK